MKPAGTLLLGSVKRVEPWHNLHALLQETFAAIIFRPCILQVTCIGQHIVCNCEVFRLASEHKCLHTYYVEKHLEVLRKQAVFPEPGTVVEIRHQNSAVSTSFFWVDDSFVKRVREDKLRCCRSSHSSKNCSHVQKVHALLTGQPYLDKGPDIHEGLDDSEAALLSDLADLGVDDEEGPSVFPGVDSEESYQEIGGPRVSFPYPISPESKERCAQNRDLKPPATILRPVLPISGCSCGLSYSDAGYVCVNMSCTVFSEGYPHFAYSAQLYDLHCPARNATCLIKYDGSADSLYCHSKDTCLALG